MKVRLLLAASAVSLAAAPFATTPAHAWYCAPDFQAVCYVAGTACNAIHKYCTLD